MKRLQYMLLMTVMGIGLLSGCSTTKVQLWSNSDSDDPTIYTQKNPHYVHVGETVQFRIPIQSDAVSYGVMDFQGQPYMLQKVNPGDYAFTWRFDETWRDRKGYLEARAYRQVDRPDYLIESGQLRKLQVGSDPADELIGSAGMVIQCYQSRVVLQVQTRGNVEPDWSKAILEIYGPHDNVSKILMGRPGIDGFVAIGKNSAGSFTVLYEPKINQIHKNGKTRAVFICPDPSGQGEVKQEIWFDTP
jgi:hypothetical protein